MNTYKEQFKEWSPAYPVFFRGQFGEARSLNELGPNSTRKSMETHNITIKAIQKAMEL